MPPILPPQGGFLFLDKAKFAESFAADVVPAAAAFMADSQVPWGVEALTGAVTKAAWKAKPSTYIVATEDRMIPPPTQRMMAAVIPLPAASERRHQQLSSPATNDKKDRIKQERPGGVVVT